MAIDITGANTYFGAAVHVKSESWTQIPKAQRIAAIAHAMRLIASRLDDPLQTNATVDGDFPRHDAAIYEQALWMLEAETLDASVKAQVLNPKQQGGSLAANIRAMQSLNNLIGPAALRFLVVNPRSVRLSLG
ncbi:MAG: hypothetical protein PHW60_05695 [Kiritimatiellae bacterium]|nr:hypothetical protein [Kiritimatiellia bacterium]